MSGGRSGQEAMGVGPGAGNKGTGEPESKSATAIGRRQPQMNGYGKGGEEDEVVKLLVVGGRANRLYLGRNAKVWAPYPIDR